MLAADALRIDWENVVEWQNRNRWTKVPFRLHLRDYDGEFLAEVDLTKDTGNLDGPIRSFAARVSRNLHLVKETLFDSSETTCKWADEGVNDIRRRSDGGDARGAR